MKRFFVFSFVFLATFGVALSDVHAATATPKLEVSGWVPYWRKATGTADVSPNLKLLKEVNPFGYTVKTDGTLFDAAKMDEEPWLSLRAQAKAEKVRFIPTVMWSNGAAIHKILSNTKTRIQLEDDITALVKEKGFDGIEIDFEGKYAETKDYFSTFLKGLYQRMGNKWVMCDIEARTPLTSRYESTPPAEAYMYANDFVAINKYCDRVKIMAYDQGAIDLKLNADANNSPYVPVADPQWVYKVINLAAETISKKKLMLGVATYGYEYKVTPLSEQGYRYDLQWAFNPGYATQIMSQYQSNVTRNRAGELSFTYIPGVLPPGASLDIETQTNLGNLPTTTYSDGSSAVTSNLATFNILWWSDARAIQDKINIAKITGIRGVSIFKLDGGEDPALWDTLRKI